MLAGMMRGRLSASLPLWSGIGAVKRFVATLDMPSTSRRNGSSQKRSSWRSSLVVRSGGGRGSAASEIPA